MNASAILISIIGFTMGFFFVAFNILLAGRFSAEIINQYNIHDLSVSRAATQLLSFILFSLMFFGIAVVWIEVLSQQESANTSEVARLWGLWWFVGFLSNSLLILIERRIRRR